MWTVWERADIFWGEIDVADQNTVSLTYEKQGDPRTAQINGETLGPGMIIMEGPDNPDPKRFSETLHVTPKGLEP
jgi:hypothetical protein